MKHNICLFYLLLYYSILTSCAQKEAKINGISFVASSKEVSQEYIEPIVNLHANYAAIMPFGFVKDLQHPEVHYNADQQWFGETKMGAMQYIDKLHQNNIAVMLKPQIWIWQGEYTGHLEMKSEEDWKALENSYRIFILDFASVAQEATAELFCIGTELAQFISHRPSYWEGLISEIRTIYKGKITYAANWDEYQRVPFWEKLDYIGVDAYFPISENETPSVKEARSGWQIWKQEMNKVSTAKRKKILFTEFGYRSVNFAGKEPWKSSRSMTDLNLEAQNNLTVALFEEFWKEDWFAGGFLWKWHLNYSEVGGVENTMFTPQNKPVENSVRAYFKMK